MWVRVPSGVLMIINEPTDEQLRTLWKHATDFMRAEKVTSYEAVYQMDNVIQHAYPFLERMGEIVGWDEYDE